MPEFDTTQVPTNESEVDALIESVESGNSEPQSPEVKADTTPDTTQSDAQTAIQKYELIRRGMKRQMTAEEMVPFAQKGWDYEEKLREFNENKANLITQTKSEIESQYKKNLQDVESKLARYREVDEYIKKDPQWWQFIQDNYSQKIREQGGNATTQNDPIVERLSQKIEELSQFVDHTKQREQLMQEAEKDQRLESEVAGYQEKFPHFDWQKPDNEGVTLEQRILKHAIDNKIASFKAAANDYLFDEHLKRHEVKAKEDTGKEIKKQAKLGLGPVTQKPTKGIERVQNVRGKSYDDLVDEALSELG